MAIFDSSSNGYALATSLTFAHTCAGADRVLYVAFHKTGGTIVSVTYDGVALTLVASESSIRLYRLIAPTVGIHDIVITLDTSHGIVAAGISYTDENQTIPEGTPVQETTTAPVTADIPSLVTDTILDVAVVLQEISGQTMVPSGTLRKLATGPAVTWYMVGVSEKPGTGSDVTMAWDVVPDNGRTVAHILVALKPASITPEFHSGPIWVSN